MPKAVKVSDHVRDAIFEVIENQINSKNPPETALTVERLVSEGHSDFETRQLIFQAMVIEVIDALKNRRPYNEKRYINNLKNLPKEPRE